jgi:hypothetical protein
LRSAARPSGRSSSRASKRRGQSQAVTGSVRSEFGKLGNSVLDFANKQGAAFGALETNTNQTSYALGKLFINAGAGTRQAATMTTQWEKLALALNQAKGGGIAGAAEALQQLQTIAAGTSTRGLHELGITITSAQVAAKAAADGFIQLGKSAAGLSPAQKQLVTFQLAMRSLPDALKQAALEANGFTAVQARLAVAWDNAKTSLGTALIPLLTKGAAALTNWLNRMERSGRLQRDFNRGARIAAEVIGEIKSAVSTAIGVWQHLSGAVGGAGNAIKIALAAFAVTKLAAVSGEIKKIAESFTGPLVAGAEGAKGAFAGFAANVKANLAQIKSNQLTTEQKARAGWIAMAKGGTVSYGRLVVAAQTGDAEIAAANQAVWDKAKVGWTEMATGVKVATAEMTTTVKAQTLGIRATFIRTFATVKAEAVGAFVTIEAAGLATMTALKAAVVSLFSVAWPLLIGTAVVYIITHWSTVKRYTLALVNASVEAFKGMGNIIVGVYQYIYGKAFYYLLTPIKDFVDEAAAAAGWLPFIGGKISAAAHAVDSFYASVHHFAESGRNRIVGGFSDITHGVTKAWNDALAKSGNDAKVNDTARKSGQHVAQSMMGGATTAINAMAPSVQKAISDALQNAVKAAHKAIVASVQAAKNNLDKIGQDLAKTIYDIQTKIGGAAGAVAGSPQGAAFAKLKKLIEEGAPAFEIQKAQAELAGQLQNVGKTQKQQVSSQLANLTAAFNKGQIGYKEFESRLHKILHDDGITMAQALKAGGPAFADAFKAEVAALGKQAQAIAAVPAKFRGIGGAGGAADIKIIQPLNVIKQEQLKVRTAVQRAAAQAERQRAAIIKNQQHQIALQQEAKSVGARAVFHHRGPTGATTAEATRRGVQEIVVHTRRTAENTTPRPAGPRGPFGAPLAPPRVRSSEPPAPERAHVAQALTSTFGRMANQIAALRTDTAGIKSAIQNEQAVLLRGLRDVCADIAAADKDIVAAELALVHPMENLRRTELRIADQASQQRDRQIRLQGHTNTLLAKLNRDKGVPGFNKERPGTGSKHAAAASRAGVKP